MSEPIPLPYMLEELPTSLPEERKRRARLTIVNHLYHNVPGEDTNGPSPLRFFRWLESEDIAYARTIKVGEEWEHLDIGWLVGKGCSYLSLENVSIRPLGTRSTPEEEIEWAAKVIEWGIVPNEQGLYTTPVGFFPPEEGTGFTPIDITKIRVRCRKGTGKLAYFVVPL